MRPFRKAPVDLTEDGYMRWLRAHRPPWSWFLQQDAETQEALAQLGDQYSTDQAIALGYAIADPKLAEAGLHAAEDPQAEESLARRVAEGLVAKILRSTVPTPTTSVTPEETLAGFGKRRSITANTPPKPKRTLFGRLPDQGGAA